MPSGKNPKPDAHTRALASVIRGVMATSDPAIKPSALAERTGIPASTISRLLKPEKQMSVWQLVAIADALGVDAGEIMTEAQRVAKGRESAHAAALRIVG